MCSQDENLVVDEDQSKHNWVLDYFELYEYLIIGLHDHLPSVTHVFKDWDSDFFPLSLSQGHGHGAAADKDMPWVGDALGDALERARKGEGEEAYDEGDEGGGNQDEDEDKEDDEKRSHEKTPSTDDHDQPPPSDQQATLVQFWSASAQQPRKPLSTGLRPTHPHGNPTQTPQKRRHSGSNDTGTEEPPQKKGEGIARGMAAAAAKERGGDDDLAREVDPYDSG